MSLEQVKLFLLLTSFFALLIFVSIIYFQIFQEKNDKQDVFTVKIFENDILIQQYNTFEGKKPEIVPTLDLDKTKKYTVKVYKNGCLFDICGFTEQKNNNLIFEVPNE